MYFPAFRAWNLHPFAVVFICFIYCNTGHDKGGTALHTALAQFHLKAAQLVVSCNGIEHCRSKVVGGGGASIVQVRYAHNTGPVLGYCVCFKGAGAVAHLIHSIALCAVTASYLVARLVEYQKVGIVYPVFQIFILSRTGYNSFRLCSKRNGYSNGQSLYNLRSL